MCLRVDVSICASVTSVTFQRPCSNKGLVQIKGEGQGDTRREREKEKDKEEDMEKEKNGKAKGRGTEK